MANRALKGRRLRWSIAAAVAVLALLVATSVLLIQFPSTDQPTKVDAIIILGEPDALSIAAATRLIQNGVSDQLVMSTPFGEPALCHQRPAGVTVSCFAPDPSTTRGEAQLIGRLAQEHGWNNIAVVTWPTHVTRSKVLIERCYSGTLNMVDYDDQMDIRDRISENFYQAGAFLKVLLQPGC